MKSLEALRTLGAGAEPPAEAKQRVYDNVLASLGLAAASAAHAAPKLINAPSTLPPSSAPLLAGAVSAKGLAIAASICFVSGLSGAALYGLLRPQEVRVVYVPAPARASAANEPVVVPTQSATAPPGSAPTAVASGNFRDFARDAKPAPENAALSQLARERALLEAARADAAHGEPARVLERVAEHRRRFPHGLLAEERDALGIRALISLGRTAEARDSARAFRAAYPNSFLTPMLDSALATP